MRPVPVRAPAVTLRATLFAALLAVLASASLATPVSAQFGSARPGDDGWALAMGGRALLDLDRGDPTLGVEARLHLPWPGFVQLRGAYDFTFLDGLTERTLLADALLTNGGLALGGGPVFRNTRLQPESPRETLEGWSAVLALGGDPRAQGQATFGIELRLIFLDAFEPRTLGVTFGLPLFQ